MNYSPCYIAVEPDGTFRPLDPATVGSYAAIKDGLHDATFDVVRLPDGETLFVDDEGMLNGSRLNVPASIMAGQVLYGPVVLTGGPDDEGDTTLPSLHTANGLMALARMWQFVEADAIGKGQSVELHADAGSLPPPTVIGLSDDEFNAYLDGTLDMQRVHDEAKRGER